MKPHVLLGDDERLSPHIFLCHAHQDKHFVRRLARDLRKLAVHVWLDEWELTVGDTLHDCIGTALEISAYVGVVLSPDSIESRWCRDELQQALTREKRVGKKVVLPLLHRRVKLPPFLEGRLYLNFSRSYFKSIAQLVGVIHDIETQKLVSIIEETPPTSVHDVQELIYQLISTSGVRYIEARKYRQIREAFEAVGIHISENAFKLFTDRDQQLDLLVVDMRLSPDSTLSSALAKEVIEQVSGKNIVNFPILPWARELPIIDFKKFEQRLSHGLNGLDSAEQENDDNSKKKES